MIRQVASPGSLPVFGFTRSGLAVLSVVLTLAIVGSVLGGIAIGETRSSASHTRKVQRAGEPTGVCLREGIKAVLPLLGRLPGADAPLTAYVQLQEKRYPGVVCPVVEGP